LRRAVAVALLFTSGWSLADESVHTALVRDIATIEGVRENALFGYGLVVGLKGTGDRQQTVFTIQTLANVLQRMGVQIPAGTVVVKNVAAVFVTATLPPFSTPGTHLDVTVSSAGDARSLEGGMLLLTPLYAADGQVYAAAQGPLTLGGYSAGSSGNAKEVNHPTVGRIPGGGLVERDASIDLDKLEILTVLLSEPNFSTAEQLAAAISRDIHNVTATVKDSRRIEVARGPDVHDVPALLAQIENLSVEVRRRARVVVNERTGTVVMGRDVRLGAVSILHGSFSIEVSTRLAVSQPEALSKGETKVVPETALKAEEGASRRIELSEGASVDQLVNGLQKIGATSRDVIAILQAIKAAGALDADLEVI
jgi:flagellar P-ring protein precursor FlgI